MQKFANFCNVQSQSCDFNGNRILTSLLFQMSTSFHLQVTQCSVSISAGCSVASSCRGALAAWSGQEVHESEQHSAAGQRHDHTQVPSDDDDDSVDDDIIRDIRQWTGAWHSQGDNQDTVVRDIGVRVMNELVSPFKAIEMDDTEFACLKAIVFFDPHARGLRDVERIKGLR